MPGKLRTLEEVMASINARLDRSDPDGCWLWPGASVAGGYGIVTALRLSPIPLYVHRLVLRESLRADGSDLPDWLDALHTCDNPPCCNPAHLFAGTAKDNVADMVAKGRGWWQKATSAA